MSKDLINYHPCEPFRAYNRLEGRPREEELDDSLAAKINDPLWMLARQYQFGELKGEDAGSAIFAKVAINSIRMTSYKGGKTKKEAYSDEIPLETRVERIFPKFDLKQSARYGRKFLQLLDEEGANAQLSLGYSAGMYKDAFIAKFPFEIPEVDSNLEKDKPEKSIPSARMLSLQQATSFLRSLSGRALNGANLWAFLGGEDSVSSSLVLAANQNPTKDKFVLIKHKGLLQNASKKWIEFLRKELNLPMIENESSWFQERLEYSFEAELDEGDDSKTTLSSEEYFHGHLDWYSFDIKDLSNRGDGRRNTVTAPDPTIKKWEVLTGIPTEANFAGMPNSRWWEMEDGSIDLGNLKASDTDIAKILVTQYALHYSNDWLCIPYDVPTGSFAEVEGILVTDTFGQNLLVESAHKNGDNWNEWNMYSLVYDQEEFSPPRFDKRLLLPPSAAKTLESEPVEEIKLIRDEMANMVWAIESRVPNGLGGGLDGYEAAGNLGQELKRLVEESQPESEIALPEVNLNPEVNRATTYKAQLRYQLGNSVSENWIPFVPVHQNGSSREIHFQRASMPRITELFDPHAIRPRTQLLREGIDEEDNQQTPFYINEEEVPRAGVKVIGTYQRTRWYNGKIVSWYGRRKRTGRGEGSSGLRFDAVLDND